WKYAAPAEKTLNSWATANSGTGATMPTCEHFRIRVPGDPAVLWPRRLPRLVLFHSPGGGGITIPSWHSGREHVTMVRRKYKRVESKVAQSIGDRSKITNDIADETPGVDDT